MTAANTPAPIDELDDLDEDDPFATDNSDYDDDRKAYLTTAISELEAEIAAQYTGSGHDDDLYEDLARIARALSLAPTN